MEAKISEIFESIQGEGIYQGVRQIFIRFYGCNLNCKFCDTKLNSYEEYNVNDLFKEINSFNGDYHSVSLTGGEPLLQVNFLKYFLPKLKKKKIYLETNGTLPEKLSQVIDYLDIVAMDIKLSSSTGLKNFWKEHKKFLEIALKKEVFVKVVICGSTKLEDLKVAVNLVKNFNKDIPFILQPNSFEIREKLILKLKDFYNYCSENLAYVRIIPQMHRILRLR